MLVADYPELVFSADESHLVAGIRSSSPRPPLGLDALRGIVEHAGYAQWPLSEAALLALLEAYNSPVASFQIPIAECRDASFTLEVSADAMQAWVSVVPACGGKALDPDKIHRVLGQAGVTFGIDPAVVTAMCSSSAHAAGERSLIAAGIAPENGEDTRFELLIEEARNRAPTMDERGLIDFRELGAIPTVSAEQPLMRRIPPTTGIVGRNVRGETIAPVPGRDEPFAQNLVGAYVADDDVNVLRAVFSGQPVCCANGVSVEQVLHLRQVNMATGNISFDGTVSIEGEVMPGMKVHATGDILVGDIIDGAELEAGGDIRVTGGIIAKAQVRAAGSVSARFVENSHVSAGAILSIDDTALQSELQANNQIIVGVKASSRGRLAGGTARAMMLIRAPILGASTVGVTRLLLGINPVLEARYQDLLKEIERLREEEANLEKLVKHFTRLGDKPDLLERTKTSWQHAIQSWARLLPEREDLERQLGLIGQARVEVSVCTEGAIDMTFGKKVMHLRQSCNTGVFALDDERIVFTDAGGEVRILN
jgi:uncharacterized protein (DUF342 family)